MSTTQNSAPQSSSAKGENNQTQSGQDQLDTSFLQQPIPATVLKQLLDKLKISIQAGALNIACQQAQENLESASPTQRISAIFNTLQIKDIRVAQLRWSRFDQRKLPAILFYQEQWQLIERINQDTLVLTNAEGEQNEFNETMLEEGLVLWLQAPKAKRKPSFTSLKDNIAARMVWSEIFRSKRWVMDVIIATVIINILAVGTSLFAMQVYDRVVPTLAYATLWTLVMGMGILVILDWLLKTVRARILDSVACSVDKAISQRVFDHVMRLQLDSRPRSLGTLAAQIRGLDSVRQFFSSSVVFALVDMPFTLVFIGVIAIIGGPISFVYLTLLPIAVILGLITQRRLRHLLKHQMIRSNERQGFLVDAIQGTESIRTNNATWRFSEEWQDVSDTISSHNVRQKAISNIATLSTGSMATCAYIAAIVVGVHQIEAGNLTMGALIACSILGGRVIAPVAQSVQYMTQWQNVSQSLQMVNQVLQLETERRPDQNLLMPDETPESIELQSVRFSYPESPIQQLNINQLSFKSGDRVALLGSIGSGKSTLLKVLAGLYRPSEGRIRLGQADLWEIDPNIIADQVSYLPQSVHLFKGTLRSNLALSGAVRDSHLLNVSNDLGIDHIAADNPHGMDLSISEGGEGLSGGQRQLVGLGRVFLAQPKIWLLDEPTASLDNESEKQVLKAIQKYVQPDDILLVATHRPALAAQFSNRVIMMQRGEIIADGKPEQVMGQMINRKPKQTANPVAKNIPSFMQSGANKGPNNVI